MMLFGVGVDTGYRASPVANLHLMNIALGLIITGGLLLVAGMVQSGFAALAGTPSVATAAAGLGDEAVAPAGKFDPAALAAKIESAQKRLGDRA